MAGKRDSLRPISFLNLASRSNREKERERESPPPGLLISSNADAPVSSRWDEKRHPRQVVGLGGSIINVDTNDYRLARAKLSRATRAYSRLTRGDTIVASPT